MKDNSNRTWIIRHARQWRSLAGPSVAVVAIALIVSAAMSSGGGQPEFEDVRMIIEFKETHHDN